MSHRCSRWYTALETAEIWVKDRDDEDNDNELDMGILTPEKINSLTDEEDVNDNTGKLSSKLPFDLAGLVEIDTNVEEMKDVLQGIFYVNVLPQMFYPSNIHLSSALKNLAKLTGKHLCWSLLLNKFEGLGLQLY